EPHLSCSCAEMLSHHFAIGLKTTAGENDCGACQHLIRVASLDFETGATPTFHERFLRVAAVYDFHACLPGRAGKLGNQCRAAAFWLDARRTFRQIVGRLNEFDAMRANPFYRLKGLSP